MLDDAILRIGGAQRRRLPPWDEVIECLSDPNRPDAVSVLHAAQRSGRPALQPRCGVGGHSAMMTLLRDIDAGGDPDILSVTIDSHTRLGHFLTASRLAAEQADQLNGYPLVSHGWQRGRELGAAVQVPVEVRHGSPDGRDLFATALAAGFTSFEGGGLGYNLPYCKDVPIAESVHAWQQIDAVTAELAALGVVLERELFGTLTAVLTPPSLSIAVTMLEAALAVEQGVRCLSISYPQSGEVHQDIAALRAIVTMARHYLPDDVTVFPVLHEYMGVFPAERSAADSLIFYGALVGRLGGAAKVVTKTRSEALGIPTSTANIDGLRLARVACSPLLDFVTIDQGRVAEEQFWIEKEVADIIEPVLDAPQLKTAICAGFAAGTLDIPFSASRHAHSAVLPLRDGTGAIRYHDAGAMPFSQPVLDRQRRLLQGRRAAGSRSTVTEITADIDYFADVMATVDRAGPGHEATP